jgi:hypothetical protein
MLLCEQKQFEARRHFLSVMYSILNAQWTLILVVVWFCTFNKWARNFIHNHIRGLEFVVLIPVLSAFTMLLLIFKTDKQKNLYWHLTSLHTCTLA